MLRNRLLATAIGCVIVTFVILSGIAAVTHDGRHPGSHLTSGPVKPAMAGLTLEQPDQLTDADAGLVGGVVVPVSWADLQPRQGGDIARPNAIDAAVQRVERFDAAHPTTPVYLKIRILAGLSAPAWAKSLDGFAPVPVVHRQEGVSGTLGPFWTPAYAAAYADFQRRLAAVYDDVDVVRDVSISQCMILYAEPFQRDVDDFSTLYSEGYSITADEACLRGQIDAQAVWTHTHQSLSLTPYRPWRTEDGAAPRQGAFDLDVTRSTMAYCRQTLGDRCTLENNSIRSDWITSTMPPSMASLYAAMAEAGGPLTFQTASPSRVGDLETTVDWARKQGAWSVEIPARYDTQAMREANSSLLDAAHG